MAAKQIPNILATFAVTLVAIFFSCYGYQKYQNGHSSERCCLVVLNVIFWNVYSVL